MYGSEGIYIDCNECVCYTCDKLTERCICIWTCDNCSRYSNTCIYCNKNYSLCNCKQYICEKCNDTIINDNLHVCTICYDCGRNNASEVLNDQKIYCYSCAPSKHTIIEYIDTKIKEKELTFSKLNCSESGSLFSYAKYASPPKLKISIECEKNNIEELEQIILCKQKYKKAFDIVKKTKHNIDYVIEKNNGENIKDIKELKYSSIYDINFRKLRLEFYNYE